MKASHKKFVILILELKTKLSAD